MKSRFRNQGTKSPGDQGTRHLISEWSRHFLVDRRAQGLSQGTYDFYTKKLNYFLKYCRENNLLYLEELTADHLRNLMVKLENEGHNAAGISTIYRTVRTFLYWYDREEEPDWSNPIKKVKAPKIPTEPLDPVDLDDVKKMLATCGNDFTGCRDRSIILTLLDTGCRASELCNVLIDDMDMATGSILIRQGKGRKPRTVYVGKTTKKALRLYLRQLPKDNKHLFITIHGDKLAYFTLVEIIRRRARDAGVKRASLHSFRRAFALQCLRNGMDIFTLQRLMGHADIQILRRYLAQTDRDLENGHRGFGPVDNTEW